MRDVGVVEVMAREEMRGWRAVRLWVGERAGRGRVSAWGHVFIGCSRTWFVGH